MPSRPPHPCNAPGCAALVTAAYCQAHQRQRAARRGKTTERGYGHRWRKLRRMVLNRDPVCACGTPAVEVDHIIGKAKGGGDDMDNLRGMCRACHQEKTIAEDIPGADPSCQPVRK
jgi:5-methylcytosine-specific restriction enzyme A